MRRPKSGAVKVLFRDFRFRDAAFTARRETASPVEVVFQPGAGMIQGGIGNYRAAGLQGCQVSALPKSVKGPEDARMAAARRYPGGLARRALPSPDGSFALGGLEDEGYALRVDCPGTEAWEDTASPGARLAPFELGPARRGRQSNRRGRPVEGFAAKLFRLRPNRRMKPCKTSPWPGAAAVSISPPDSRAATWYACAPPGCRPPARTSLPGIPPPGNCRAERGFPWPYGPRRLRRARRSARRPHQGEAAGSRAAGWSGQSDAAGRYRLEGLAGREYSVDVREAGHVPWRMTWEAETGKTAELKALLEPGQALQGMHPARPTANPRRIARAGPSGMGRRQAGPGTQRSVHLGPG